MILIVYENILETIFVGLVYIKGNFLKLNDTDFSYLLKVLKHSLIQNLNKKIAELTEEVDKKAKKDSKKENEYKLEITYNKDKSVSVNDIIPQIQVKVHTEQEKA